MSCYCRTERHVQQQTLTSGHQETTTLQSYYCRQSSDSQWVKVSKGASNNRNLAALSTIHVRKNFWTSSWAARPCYSSHFHCGRLYLVSNGNIGWHLSLNVFIFEVCDGLLRKTRHRLVQGALSGEDVRESLVEGFFFFFYSLTQPYITSPTPVFN